MSFLDPWTTTYEGVPPDTENLNLGANRIRDFKVNVRQRANVDHSFGDTLDNGRHNQVSLNVSSVDPSPAGSVSFLYAKPILGNMELFYRDNGGSIVQFTAGGVINFSPFPSGTRIPFVQASPPTGWTLVSGFNDQVLRMVNDGSGGTTGGSWTISGTTVTTGLGTMGASSPASSSGSVSGTVAGHQLILSEIPSHTHTVSPSLNSSNGNAQAGGTGTVFLLGGGPTTFSTASQGGDGQHSHGWSGSISVSTSVTTTLSGTPSATFSNDASWRPAYVNSCIGQKT